MLWSLVRIAMRVYVGHTQCKDRCLACAMLQANDVIVIYDLIAVVEYCKQLRIWHALHFVESVSSACLGIVLKPLEPKSSFTDHNDIAFKKSNISTKTTIEPMANYLVFRND